MPNECWRKIQQREIVVTNKDDIMTCVQENNLFKKLREILCIQTRKVMSTDKFRETAFSPWLLNTAISRKVVGKNVNATISKGNMGYDQYPVPDTVAVEPTFVAFF